jgi:hypothetical protein
MFAHGGAGCHPIAVPDICRQKVSPKVKMLHCMTMRRVEQRAWGQVCCGAYIIAYKLKCTVGWNVGIHRDSICCEEVGVFRNGCSVKLLLQCLAILEIGLLSTSELLKFAVDPYSEGEEKATASGSLPLLENNNNNTNDTNNRPRAAREGVQCLETLNRLRS